MPLPSLVRFQNRGNSRGQRLFWGRVDVDGLPYRGEHAPLMPEAEYEQRAVRVADVRNSFFDVNDAAQNQAYLDVLECCANGWFQLLHIVRFWNNTTQHYIEWAEFYMQDGGRVPFAPAHAAAAEEAG